MSLKQKENIDIPESLVDEKKNTIYLSGPIRKAEDNGRSWREDIVSEYSDHFDFCNPLDKFNPTEHEILSDPVNISEEPDKSQIIPSEYVPSDKLGIRESEFMFVGLPEIIARGTCMECQYAYEHNTPFFVWTMDGQEESGWLFHHAEVMYDDRDALMDYIQNYE
jgi:hypothetical protein